MNDKIADDKEWLTTFLIIDGIIFLLLILFLVYKLKKQKDQEKKEKENSCDCNHSETILNLKKLDETRVGVNYLSLKKSDYFSQV
jgi:preprotein translocase subunit SecG